MHDRARKASVGTWTESEVGIRALRDLVALGFPIEAIQLEIVLVALNDVEVPRGCCQKFTFCLYFFRSNDDDVVISIIMISSIFQRCQFAVIPPLLSWSCYLGVVVPFVPITRQ